MLKTFLSVSLSLLFLFSPCLVLADQDPSLPDISGWNVVIKSNIEVRVSDDVIAYLGTDIEYQNPKDPVEFVRVINRHISLVIMRRKAKDNHVFSDMIVTLYAQNQERNLLKELSAKVDPIIYIKWRTQKDLSTESNILDGDVSIWFCRLDGTWTFTKNKRVDIEFLSENVQNGERHNILAGRKYQVGNEYQILGIDTSDIATLKGWEK